MIIDENIEVQTRQGNSIDNYQSEYIGNFERKQFEEIVSGFNECTFKGRPTAMYNCHGFTFASQRTNIGGSDEVKRILDEDDYNEIKKDSVLPGDIIIYYSENGDVEHSGVVIQVYNEDLVYPKIISKWGKYKVAIHHANNSPYTMINAKYYRVIE